MKYWSNRIGFYAEYTFIFGFEFRRAELILHATGKRRKCKNIYIGAPPKKTTANIRVCVYFACYNIVSVTFIVTAFVQFSYFSRQTRATRTRSSQIYDTPQTNELIII